MLLQRGWKGYRHRCDHRKHEEPDHDSHPDETGCATTAKISTDDLVRCVCAVSDIPVEQPRPVGEKNTFLFVASQEADFLCNQPSRLKYIPMLPVGW